MLRIFDRLEQASVGSDPGTVHLVRSRIVGQDGSRFEALSVPLLAVPLASSRRMSPAPNFCLSATDTTASVCSWHCLGALLIVQQPRRGAGGHRITADQGAFDAQDAAGIERLAAAIGDRLR